MVGKLGAKSQDLAAILESGAYRYGLGIRLKQFARESSSLPKPLCRHLGLDGLHLFLAQLYVLLLDAVDALVVSSCMRRTRS